MARSPIPDALARRHVLERQLAPQQALRIGEAYLAQGRRLEAVDLLRKGGATAPLEELCRQAVEEGDAFLLRQARAALGRAPAREEWLRLAESAEARGKLRYATEARRQAGAGSPKV